MDYSGMHAVMLYSKVGAELPDDPYDVEVSGVPRDLVKRTFNALINAPTQRLDEPSDYDQQTARLSWADFKRRIIETHAPIKEFLYSGYGVHLQMCDSEIAENVMLRFVASDYPCLPVHDSFIVHHGLADEVKDIMLDEFEKKTGRKITAKHKGSLIDIYKPDPTEVEINMDISEYLKLDNSYDARWAAWLSTQHRMCD